MTGQNLCLLKACGPALIAQHPILAIIDLGDAAQGIADFLPCGGPSSGQGRTELFSAANRAQMAQALPDDVFSVLYCIFQQLFLSLTPTGKLICSRTLYRKIPLEIIVSFWSEMTPASKTTFLDYDDLKANSSIRAQCCRISFVFYH